MNLNKYIKFFEELNTNKSPLGIAPHKPILLLAVIDGYEKNLIKSEKIYITPELVANFRDNWDLLVKTEHVPTFALPFFHLKNEKGEFWNLIPNAGYEKSLSVTKTISSFKLLNSIIEYAKIDKELYLLLSDKDSRNELRNSLLTAYFPETRHRYSDKSNSESNYLKSIEDKLIRDTSATYKIKDEELDEEGVFVRGSAFKKVIPRVYNYTCCVSGLRVDAFIDIQMIDACHIVPFSISGNDTINNGISLCPNLHRAFDRGLIAFDDDFKVLISSCFSESQQTTYSLKQFSGKKMILPEDELFYPSLKSLKWHRENKFIQNS